MVPLDALTRYSMSDGENGPPGGPETAMLVAGVTINVGGDCPVGLCAAAISIDKSITDMHSKTIDANWRVPTTANVNIGARSPSIAFRGHDTSKRLSSHPKSDTRLV
jgi:hypothetical protein